MLATRITGKASSTRRGATAIEYVDRGTDCSAAISGMSKLAAAHWHVGKLDQSQDASN